MIKELTDKAPGVIPTLGFSLLARVPIGALGLLIVLGVTEHGFSYAIAGLCITCCALSVSISAPLLGRLSDRIGPSPVLVGSGIASIISLGAFILVSSESPAWVFLFLSALSGGTQPPVPACARAVWKRSYPTEVFDRIVTMDAALQEAAFVIGPLVLVPFATLTSPSLALVIVGILSGGSALAFAALAEAREQKANLGYIGKSLWGPLTQPGVAVLTLLAVAAGTGFGATELGIVRTADSFDAESWSGILFAALGLGSLIGGLLAVRYVTARPIRRMVGLLMFLTAAILLLALASNLVTLGALLLLTGLSIAPVFGIMYALVGLNSPKEMLTEAFALATSGITIGLAIGAALAGVSGTLTVRGPFYVAAAAMIVAAIFISVFGRLINEREEQPAIQRPLARAEAS